ncbi:hypothetical protein [Haloarcula mannanilytica]|uniref:hypothetical protein n=1 Tax=Haloarcula mannanilytica TaxID=2509225 RepID=UPI00135ADCF4|nr:hypothetical protein [Haloarcula mannanilytica]
MDSDTWKWTSDNGAKFTSKTTRVIRMISEPGHEALESLGTNSSPWPTVLASSSSTS